MAGEENALVSNFRVETQGLSVELSFGQGPAPLAATIYLRPRAALHSGTETVRDRLADGSFFLPLRLASSDEVVLVAKSQIRYLRAPTPIDEDSMMLERAGASARVDIELDTGEAQSGELFFPLRPGQSRMLDYLNNEDVQFVCLGQGDKDCFIGRSHMRLVRELKP